MATKKTTRMQAKFTSTTNPAAKPKPAKAAAVKKLPKSSTENTISDPAGNIDVLMVKFKNPVQSEPLTLLKLKSLRIADAASEGEVSKGRTSLRPKSGAARKLFIGPDTHGGGEREP